MRAIKTTTISILALGLLAGSAIGAAAQDEEATAAVYATGTWVGDPAALVDPTDIVDLPTGNDARGIQIIDAPVEFTDPRLSGLLSISANATTREFPNGVGWIETRTYRIINDDGAWAGPGYYANAMPETDLLIGEETMVLIGEGAYAGYIAYVTNDITDGTEAMEALILEADLPPTPEMPPTE